MTEERMTELEKKINNWNLLAETNDKYLGIIDSAMKSLILLQEERVLEMRLQLQQSQQLTQQQQQGK